MFQSLSDRLSGVLDKLTRRGALTESDVNEAMREVRRALLEADVALDVVRSFIDRVRAKAVGANVVKSVTPGQMVVKIVHDELVETLGSDAQPIDLAATPPVAIMLVGLQGSGKTTTCAKIGKRLTDRDRKKVLMASLDTRRPAAQEQLRVLGEQTGVATLPIIAGQTPRQIAQRSLEAARLGGYDVVLLDTAGRTHIDDELMQESADIRDIAKPHETLLVADSLTGQDAVNLARNFNDRVGITGIVLTRVDGDGRGGAALSMRAVTGKPIKLIGVGERWDALEDFHPQRIAGRILGMGDVVSLVEKAAQTIDAEKAQAIAQKMRKGEFDLEDLGEQLKQMQQMGGMGGLMGMLPGVAKVKQQMAAGAMDDKVIKRQGAIISSMTPYERRHPKVLDGKRKRRIAAGSGTRPDEVNRLLKMHRQMADMMKMMGKNKGMMQRMAGAFGLGGGPAPNAAEVERMQAELARLDPKALEQLPKEVREQLGAGGGKGAAPSLPGLGKAMPRLPGLPGLGGATPAVAGPSGLSGQEEIAMIPTLETERLRLRPWRNDDLDAFAAFTADRAATRFVGGTFSRGDTWRRIAMFLGHWQLRGFGNWAIEEKSSGAFVGYSGLWKPEGWPEPEVMWGLLPAFHGRGYATEAATRARTYAFRELRWPTAVSYIVAENLPSRRVAERLGATRDGTSELKGTAVDVWRHPSPQH